MYKILFFFKIYIDKKNQKYYNWPCQQVKNTKARQQKQKKVFYKIFKFFLTRKIKSIIIELVNKARHKKAHWKKFIKKSTFSNKGIDNF